MKSNKTRVACLAATKDLCEDFEMPQCSMQQRGLLACNRLDKSLSKALIDSQRSAGVRSCEEPQRVHSTSADGVLGKSKSMMRMDDG